MIANISGEWIQKIREHESEQNRTPIEETINRSLKDFNMPTKLLKELPIPKEATKMLEEVPAIQELIKPEPQGIGWGAGIGIAAIVIVLGAAFAKYKCKCKK
tara:strand:- start:49 stop:354 length:306 start_codon:yes stop_codon:yes gene_type:complete